MGALDTSKCVRSYETREWQYRRSGFTWSLGYYATEYQEWVTAIDAKVDGYIAATPGGFTQDGWDNDLPYGEPDTGYHTDRFRKRGAWTAL